MEFSYIDQANIISEMEALVTTVFKESFNVDLPAKFPQMTYAEAMDSYGSDKPDLRTDKEDANELRKVLLI